MINPTTISTTVYGKGVRFRRCRTAAMRINVESIYHIYIYIYIHIYIYLYVKIHDIYVCVRV